MEVVLPNGEVLVVAAMGVDAAENEGNEFPAPSALAIDGFPCELRWGVLLRTVLLVSFARATVECRSFSSLFFCAEGTLAMA